MNGIAIEPKVIESGDGKRLVVGPADYRRSAKRSYIAALQQKIVGDPENDVDEVDGILRLYTYPAMIASVIEHSGFDQWPPAFEDVATLPEEFALAWENAAFECNPSWAPQTPSVDDEKKDVS